MSYKEEMQQVNTQIAEFEKIGKKPPKTLYAKQIMLLEKAHDEFIETAKKKGYDLSTNLDILEIEIKQFSAMKQVAEKIELPTIKYDDLIKQARTRIYGEEATKTVFKEN